MVGGAGIAALLRFADQAAWGQALAFVLPVCLVYSFVALSAYYVCRSVSFTQRRWPVAIALFGGASLLSALAWLGLGEAWNLAGRLVERDALVTLAPTGWVLWFGGGFVMYLLSLLAHDVLIAFESVRTAAQREAQSRVLARDAELQVLRTQIDPHFLFNSLNSISALTAIDAEAARAMTVDLAQFFRRTLALADRERVTLAQEVELCRDYLAIEQRRFGTKLRAELRIVPEAEACLLPPMTLQPLLENAIKHAIRHLDEGGTLEVDAAVHADWLRLAVVNPVAPDAEERAGAHERSGLGLANLRERLANVYATRAHIEWRRTPTRFEVEISLPCERMPAMQEQEALR
jgi:signal transduction histidine kinase